MEKKQKNIKTVAGKNFHPSDYQRKNELEKGLSETHEQVSDNYFEGTVDQLLNEEK